MSPLERNEVAEARLDQALELARGGRSLELQRDLVGARGRYEDAVLLLADLDPTPLLAKLLRWNGSVCRDLGEIDRADALYARSYDVSERTGATAGQASALNCRAVIAQRRGDVEEATTLYRRAARLATEAGEIRLAGMIEQNLGVLANIRGDLDGALVRYRAALRAFREVADDEAVSWVLNNMGMLLTDLGLSNRAEKCFLDGLEIAEARRDGTMEGVLRTNYAECLTALRRWDEARHNLGLGLGIARRGGDRTREGEALKLLGVLERELGNLEDAAPHLNAAVDIGSTMDDPLLVAESLRERGRLRALQGRPDDAERDWVEAHARFSALHATLDADRTTALIESLDDQREDLP